MSALRPSGKVLMACLTILVLIIIAAVAMKPSQFGFGSASVTPSIDGLRSAKLGLTEGQLRRALSIDYGATDEAIRGVVHPQSGNRILMIAVRGLIPGAPVARVNFVIDTASERLSQINVTWIEGKEPGIDETALMAIAQQLIDQFETLGYSSNIPGVSSERGHLFATADERGRRMDIFYRAATSSEGGARRESGPREASLTLSIRAQGDAANTAR